jgi:hypothetical protein
MLLVLMTSEGALGYLAILLFLPVAACFGCAWIWLLARINANLLPAIRLYCKVGLMIFSPFCLVAFLVQFMLWKIGLVKPQEPPDGWFVIFAPAWVFILFLCLYYYSGRELLRRCKQGIGQMTDIGKKDSIP